MLGSAHFFFIAQQLSVLQSLAILSALIFSELLPVMQVLHSLYRFRFLEAHSHTYSSPVCLGAAPPSVGVVLPIKPWRPDPRLGEERSRV